MRINDRLRYISKALLAPYDTASKALRNAWISNVATCTFGSVKTALFPTSPDDQIGRVSLKDITAPPSMTDLNVLDGELLAIGDPSGPQYFLYWVTPSSNVN